MFNFSQLQGIHLEITNNCQAKCPMCSRNHHGGMINPLIEITEWSFDDFKAIITQEVLDQINSIYFCGNFGDPLLNKDLIKMCQYVRDSSDVSIRIHTNASLRNSQWWRELAKSLPKEHMVIFGIDGLADTHSKYRIGTNYNTIIKNARTFISNGGRAEWAFIVFKHNQHQVLEAKKIAKEIGFEKFTIKHSNRFLKEPKFEVYDSTGKTVDILEPSSETPIKFLDRKAIKDYRKMVNDSEIECHALKMKEIYIDANKNLMPCCFLASAPYNYSPPEDAISEVRMHILEQHNKLIDELGCTSTLEKSIKEIINLKSYQTVWDKYWSTDKLVICARTCGKNKFSKPKDQFIERKILKGNDRCL